MLKGLAVAFVFGDSFVAAGLRKPMVMSGTSLLLLFYLRIARSFESAEEPVNCGISTCSSTDEVGLLQHSTKGLSNLTYLGEESQTEENPTQKYIVGNDVKCVYGDDKCPYGSPKES